MRRATAASEGKVIRDQADGKCRAIPRSRPRRAKLVLPLPTSKAMQHPDMPTSTPPTSAYQMIKTLADALAVVPI